MDKVLASIMEQLNQISVRGDDVERLAAAKHMLRQLQAASVKAKSNPERKESPQNE